MAIISSAQLDTLKDIRRHRKAVRVLPSYDGASWVWQVGGVARSGPVERLYQAGFLEAVDRHTLRISERGRQVLIEQAA